MVSEQTRQTADDIKNYIKQHGIEYRTLRLEVIRAGLLSGTDVKVVSSEENIKSIDAAIDAIEENQQYRAIGTPEEN